MMDISTGMIVIWYGPAGTIPVGYYRCDGNNGTPNLKDRYPFCGDFIQPAGAVSGVSGHAHVGSTFPHNHTFPAGMGLGAGSDYDAETNESEPTVTLAIADNIPPTAALHYIQKA